jgi:hypothetical protein
LLLDEVGVFGEKEDAALKTDFVGAFLDFAF